MAVYSFENSLAVIIRAKAENLYDNLVVQLQKDFSRANIDVKITASLFAAEVEKLIQEKLYVLLLEKFDAYLNLLYVIDIPEKSMRQIKSNDIVEISKQVCLLILEREFQKVWYKNQFA